jgi:hypothetical protein
VEVDFPLVMEADFFVFSPFLTQIYVWTPEILFARLDLMLDAIDCGAEVTQLGATAYGAELCDVEVRVAPSSTPQILAPS